MTMMERNFSLSDELKVRRIASLISDAFAFVKGQEVNKALSEVTFDDLLEELIQRNGDSDRSNKYKYDPYAYNEVGDEPAEMPTVIESEPQGNPVSGTSFKNPTKLDRLLALKNAIEEQVEAVKKEEIPEDAYSGSEEGILVEEV